MKFKCCKSALSSLIIGDNALSFCCWFTHDGYSFLQNYNGETDFIEKYKESRNKFIENCKNETANYDICFNCSKFTEQEWDETFGIDYISLTERRKCSCNCIYCIVTKGDTKKRAEFNKKKIWDIEPVLKYLADNKVLKKEGTLFIGAGECSEYPKEKLQWLINYAKENNFSLEIASSAFFYSEDIAQVLKEGKISITVSVDSGTKEIFEKIKRAKFYNQVWKNLDQYIKAAKNNPNAKVIIKYIILDGINDDIEEFNSFINMCNKVNCKNIEISMDINYQTDRSVLNVTPTEKIRKLISHIQDLNDDRIYFQSVVPIKEMKTTARNFDFDIEQGILRGDTTVKIFVFAVKEETYNKLTNTDLHKQIWENIKIYAETSKQSKSFFSELYIQYMILPEKNDNLIEIKEFLKRCKDLNIKHIEFDLINEKSLQKDNIKMGNLKESINYLTSLNSQSIRISERLLNLVK